MRIGAGAYDATSYNSIASRNITTSINNNTATTAFVLNVGTAGTYYGSIVLTNVTGNIWALSSILADPANNALNTAAGTHTTSAALSQLQLIMSDGTSTMTGTINIAYE
jgi:cysteine synthase